jgi:hypothetical protein
MTAHRSHQRYAVHSATEAAIAPHQTIKRGMPLARVGEHHDPPTRRYNLPVFAAYNPRTMGHVGPTSIAASDVITGDERGAAFVVDDGGDFPIAELVLPENMTVRDGDMVGGVRVIDPREPERR